MTDMMVQILRVYSLSFMCWLIVGTAVPACNARDRDHDLARPVKCEPGERDPMYGGRIPAVLQVRVFATDSRKELSCQRSFEFAKQDFTTLVFTGTRINGCELTVRFLGQRGDVDDYVLIMDLRGSTNSISLTEPRCQVLEEGGFYHWHVSFSGEKQLLLSGPMLDIGFRPGGGMKYTDLIDWRALNADELRDIMEKLKVGGKETWHAFYLLAGQGKKAIELLIENSSDLEPMADAEWTRGLHCGRLIDPPIGVFYLYLVEVILRKQQFHSWPVIVPDDFSKGLDMTGLDIGTTESIHKRAVKLYEKWWEQVKHLDLDEIRRTVRPLGGSGLRWVDDYKEDDFIELPGERYEIEGFKRPDGNKMHDVRKEDDKK